jgi:myosin tail region-interacting protein MTI1
LQHALEDEPSQVSQDTIDYNDADTHVTHEVGVQQFTQAAEPRQPSDNYDESEKYTSPEASRLGSTVHGQYTTDEYAAAQVHFEGEPLAPALSADDVGDTEMAPPRVTRPLPAAPAPPSPAVSISDEPIITQTRVPPPPAIPKRYSLPPTRAIPVPTPDSPPFVPDYSPQRTPSGKRSSVPPPSRGLPVYAPETPDVGLQRRQSSTKRTSVPPPTRGIPSPYVPGLEPPIVPPPPPPSLGYAEQEPPTAREPEYAEEEPQLRDERISPPPFTPTRKASLPPPIPDGRRIVESRRSIDPRPSPEERRRSGQYAVQTAPAIPGPASPPSKKQAPPSLPLEKEVIDEDIGGARLTFLHHLLLTGTTVDPIDPQFHTLRKTLMTAAVPLTPPPTTSDPLSFVSPASTADLRHGNDSEGEDGLKRRKTIVERMAKLGAIKFGAPPPTHRVQPPAPIVTAESAGAEGSTAGSGQLAPEEPEALEEEESEQARRERIAAKLAGMGGMRLGMLPVHPGIGVAPPRPPPVPVRREEEATPRPPPRAIPPPSQSAALPSESDQAYEHPSSSDDGVQVEAEDSELEEVRHEDLEDEYDVEDVEEEEQTPQLPPLPPPPRATRPPIPLARPPVPPTGRRLSTEVPSTPSPRSGSFDTVTSVPRHATRQSASDFVMVEAEEAQTSLPARPLRGPPPPRSAPPAPQLLDPAGGSSTSQWELPSIPSGSLDFSDSGGAASDLSASMWSEDSTAYPPAAAAPSSAPPTAPPTAISLHSVTVAQPRASVGVPARMTVDELRTAWERVGVYVAEAASGLLERSKRTLVGNGSYEGFVAEVLAQVPSASPPHAPGEYGFLVYAQTGTQVHTRLADIMPGDVVVLRGAKLKGHKGLQSYSMSAGEGTLCVGIVSEFDAKKLKLKALQANQRVGQAVRTRVVGNGAQRC